MTYRQAKRLHNEDEVTVKKTGVVVTVISAEVFGPPHNAVKVETTGGTYWHKEIR